MGVELSPAKFSSMAICDASELWTELVKSDGRGARSSFKIMFSTNAAVSLSEPSPVPTATQIFSGATAGEFGTMTFPRGDERHLLQPAQLAPLGRLEELFRAEFAGGINLCLCGWRNGRNGKRRSRRAAAAKCRRDFRERIPAALTAPTPRMAKPHFS